MVGGVPGRLRAARRLGAGGARVRRLVRARRTGRCSWAAHDLLRFGLALPATILRAALLVAAPAIAVAAALQLALAAVARVVPRFSSFTLAFPIVFGAALLVTIAAIPLLAPLGARPWLVLPWSAR